ncbi:MAG: dTDP-4-dehydrorhamnose 3,5-epimerase [Bacteroidota bacterium]|jgi:dTDP-4-dehydrorhamnose 3,5-epimerase|nr:dTDP-4-dehydrorhamnose 3,5-epimerase [Bacteroidota bacterium]GDX47701.1 dTDP-4-dehydrorhamnose 3,5-epimerase [Bacteroidota bacterium]
MPFKETGIQGLYVFEPKVLSDERGYFYESYNENIFNDFGITTRFVQDNQSYSKKNTIRGLHYQLNPNAQAKLVRVIYGEVLDVAVDLRRHSPTYGKHFSVRLSADNHLQLYIPRGFAHGYSVLSETAIFFYKCDGFYHKESERGILYNDPDLAIDWLVNEQDAIVSQKDKLNVSFHSAESNF